MSKGGYILVHGRIPPGGSTGGFRFQDGRELSLAPGGHPGEYRKWDGFNIAVQYPINPLAT